MIVGEPVRESTPGAQASNQSINFCLEVVGAEGVAAFVGFLRQKLLFDQEVDHGLANRGIVGFYRLVGKRIAVTPDFVVEVAQGDDFPVDGRRSRN